MTEPKEPASLNALVAGLAASALAGMQQAGAGDQAGASEGEPAVDVSAIRQIIDMLVVLQDKTRGNLTDEEQQFLERTVTDLKFAFVRLTGPPGSGTT